MIGFLSLGLVLHFIAVGVWIGLWGKRIDMKLLIGVFSYFFVVHVALGLFLGAFPYLIDPR